jgi:hypothetical protein
MDCLHDLSVPVGALTRCREALKPDVKVLRHRWPPNYRAHARFVVTDKTHPGSQHLVYLPIFMRRSVQDRRCHR